MYYRRNLDRYSHSRASPNCYHGGCHTTCGHGNSNANRYTIFRGDTGGERCSHIVANGDTPTSPDSNTGPGADCHFDAYSVSNLSPDANPSASSNTHPHRDAGPAEPDSGAYTPVLDTGRPASAYGAPHAPGRVRS